MRKTTSVRWLAATLLALFLSSMTGCRGILGIQDLSADDHDSGLADDAGTNQQTSSPDGATNQQTSSSDGGGQQADADANRGGDVLDAQSDGSPSPAVARLTAAPSALDFGRVTEGQTVSNAQIQITNAGNAATSALSTSITGSGFSIAADGCKGKVLLPALSCTVTVALGTMNVGSLVGTLSLTDAPLDAVSITLSANVLAVGALTVSPAMQTFPGVPVGSTGTPVTFTVSNTGMAATGMLTAALGGTNASDFIVMDACSGKTLMAGAMCTVSVTSAPVTSGPKTASLTVSGTPGGAASASLRGQGLQASSLTASPTSFVFPNVALFNPGTLPTKTITVSNGGDLPSGALVTSLVFGNGTGNAEFKITADTCNGQPLAGMAVCHVMVQFQPTTHGSKSATLQINGGAPSVALSGTAADEVMLTVTKGGAGAGTVTDSSGQISCGSTCSAQFGRTVSDPVVTLTEAPDGSSVFAGWSGGGCTGTATSCAVSLSVATTVTAAFAPIQQALTVNFHGLGTQAASIASSPPGITCSGTSCTSTASFNGGSTVTLTVTQGAGSLIAWSNACSGTTCAVTLNQATTTLNVTTTNQNIVFATSQTHNANFGGLAGANAICNSSAAAAWLPGVFVAFLATSATSVYAPLGSSRGWIRPDGLPFTDTIAGLQNQSVMWYPPALNENGKVGPGNYYTGETNFNCSDWTSATATVTTLVGGNGESEYFVGTTGAYCSSTYSGLLCFGTNLTTPVSVTPVPGRHVFVSSAPFTPSAGLAAADSLCQTEAQAAGLANSTSFLAALATTTASASSRFDLSRPTWVRVDGVEVATTPAAFMAGTLIAPVSTDQHGNAVTGDIFLGSSGGLKSVAQSGAEDCADWSSLSATGVSDAPELGGPIYANSFALGFSPLMCGAYPGSVLCLEN